MTLKPFDVYVDDVFYPSAQIREMVDNVIRLLSSSAEGLPIFSRDGSQLSIVVCAIASQLMQRPFCAFPADQFESLSGAIVDVWPSVKCEITNNGREWKSMPKDTAVAFQTSGSEGGSKYVTISKDGLQFQRKTTADILGITADDEMLLAIPTSHAYGFSILQCCMETGADLHLLNAFSLRMLKTVLKERQITTFDGVPAMYRAILNKCRCDEDLRNQIRRLRIRGCGGDVLPKWLAEEFKRLLHVDIHDGYGLTEAGPNVAINTPTVFRMGSVGKAMPGVSIRIEASSGEILVSSPSLLTSYASAEHELAAPIETDGYLKTGDHGRLDSDGFLYVDGRLKQMIVHNGRKLAPADLEQCLINLDGIAELGVSAVRLPTDINDRVYIFISRTKESQTVDLSTVAIRKIAEQFAIPSVHIRWKKELPRTKSGKLDRNALRELALHEVTLPQ